MAVMVLFRDRFRLVAPSSGTKFAHALIKYRLSQMSLHRIHHPTQKAVHDPRKAPLSSPRPKPIGALWLVFQLFPQLACFPIASGWGILPVLRLFTQPTCFPLASGWGDFPGFPTFPPTRLLPCGFRLGDFPGFPAFRPIHLLLYSKNARLQTGRFQTYISNYSNSTLSLLVYPCPYSSAPELPVHHHSLHHS